MHNKLICSWYFQRFTHKDIDKFVRVGGHCLHACPTSWRHGIRTDFCSQLSHIEYSCWRGAFMEEPKYTHLLSPIVTSSFFTSEAIKDSYHDNDWNIQVKNRQKKVFVGIRELSINWCCCYFGHMMGKWHTLSSVCQWLLGNLNKLQVVIPWRYM